MLLNTPSREQDEESIETVQKSAINERDLKFPGIIRQELPGSVTIKNISNH